MIASARWRCINANQPFHLNRKPSFFQDLAGTCLGHAFPGFHISAGHAPQTVICPASKQHFLLRSVKHTCRATNGQAAQFSNTFANQDSHHFCPVYFLPAYSLLVCSFTPAASPWA